MQNPGCQGQCHQQETFHFPDQPQGLRQQLHSELWRWVNTGEPTEGDNQGATCQFSSQRIFQTLFQKQLFGLTEEERGGGGPQ